MLTPLAHLGYFETVEKAPYDHLRAVDAIRGYVSKLPQGEQDYLDACRAYTDTLYTRRMGSESRRYFLDKTPAYSLVLPFIAKLYPNARYIVLTRQPIAIFSSYAKSFFEDDYEAAYAFNPILERYVPAIARFIVDKPVPHIFHVKYEDMVQDPETWFHRICEFLDLKYEADAIEYGKHKHDDQGLGDPTGVKQHSRPVTSSIEKWAAELAADSKKEQIVRRMIANLDPNDVRVWGYEKADLFKPLDEGSFSATGHGKKKKEKWDKHKVERWALRKLRKNIHHNWIGKIVRKIRFTCDVLLR